MARTATEILETFGADSIEYVQAQLQSLSIDEIKVLMRLFECGVERLTEKTFAHLRGDLKIKFWQDAIFFLTEQRWML